MLIFLAIGHTLLVVAFTTRILLREDLTPPARLAWYIVINLLPYFFIPLDLCINLIKLSL